MNILYIGDVMGDMGIAEVERMLPSLKLEYKIDLVIAQSENVSAGKGMTPKDMARLQAAGVQFFTGGNHTPKKPELYPLLEDSDQPVIGPVNMHNCPGMGYKYIDTPNGRVLIVSLLGSTVGREIASDNPLKAIDKILSEQIHEERVATIVNFHGDYSSEKVIIGHYLDGRVTAVIGDHWHVPTADAQVLPKGTAHITDIGMTGSLDSSLGVTFDSVVPRWRDGIQTRNNLESGGRIQFNALFIETDDTNRLAKEVEHIRTVRASDEK